MIMELTPKEHELLIRAFSFYYEHCIWADMAETDNAKASSEDYNIRQLTNKLKIRDMFPPEIKMRW